MMRNQGAPPGNVPMKDFVKLESSLFTLTKKCMRTCKDFVEQNFQLKTDEFFYSNLKAQQKTNQAFNFCLEKCTADYATLNKHVRMTFMEDMDKVQEKNQEIYDDFYR